MLFKIFSYIPWLLLAALYIPTFWSLYRERWETLDYHHAYFILPAFLLMLWSKRDKIKETFPKNGLFVSAFFVFLFLIGVWFFITGWRWNYLALQTLSLPIVLLSLFVLFYGTKILKTVIVPIAYLALLIPLPLGILDQITLPLRYVSSIVATKILSVVGYPVLRKGLLIHLDDHEIFLGEPCSGFRSLITFLSLGLVYLYFNKASLKKNVLLFLTIIPLSFLGNVIRILLLCLITYYLGEEVAQGFFHDFSGIVIFMFVTSSLLLLEKRIPLK